MNNTILGLTASGLLGLAVFTGLAIRILNKRLDKIDKRLTACEHDIAELAEWARAWGEQLTTSAGGG